jgi:hypothetical protein
MWPHEQVDVAPRDDGVVGDGSPDLRSDLIGGGLVEAMLKQQVIPANDGILDEAVAGLGDLLLLLISGAELTRISSAISSATCLTPSRLANYRRANPRAGWNAAEPPLTQINNAACRR